jgi:1-deoxy-D-xylulose-5-phosphate reductoisomerase
VSAPRSIAVLGSTGSIGRSTLEVARALPDRLTVAVLTANVCASRLERQVAEFRPRLAAVAGQVAAAELAGLREACRKAGTRLVAGPEGLREAASLAGVDLVVNAIVGAAGVEPTLEAIRAGKSVALANKESLVAAGEIIVAEADRAGIDLVPVDSEHSAVYQCIRGESRDRIRRLILTASGGPLVDADPAALAGATVEEALNHPTWAMGRKVTIDSATLVNKGFEMIEAHWLFGVAPDRIDVVIERKSVVHAMVEFIDGSVSALLSSPDMKLPIQYALTHPDRVESSVARLALEGLGGLVFEKPDHQRFPCLGLAYEALARGGTAPAALSAADEVAVDAFLDGKIRFGEIHPILREVVEAHQPSCGDSLEAVLEADRWARRATGDIIARRRR